MEYIKIKHVHVPANMTDAELGKLVKFQLEIARIERAMTESEKCAFFGRKEAQKSWENVTGADLHICQSKVVYVNMRLQARTSFSPFSENIGLQPLTDF